MGSLLLQFRLLDYLLSPAIPCFSGFYCFYGPSMCSAAHYMRENLHLPKTSLFLSFFYFFLFLSLLLSVIMIEIVNSHWYLCLKFVVCCYQLLYLNQHRCVALLYIFSTIRLPLNSFKFSAAAERVSQISDPVPIPSIHEPVR